MPASFSEFERLFLLEFFVDYVNIQNASLDNVDSVFCVSFQFLHYPNMRVCEEDFTPKTRPLSDDSKIIFKSGKSCLFSVHSDQQKKIPSEFNLIIAVCQKVRCSHGMQLIGQATVNLGSSFMNLLQPSEDQSPTTGVRHDLFPLKDKFGKVVGSIAAFARISCYGKLIVTQFQLADTEQMNYMFKGTDTENMFKGNEPPCLPNIECGEGDIPKDTPYDELFGYPKEDNECENAIFDDLSAEEEEEFNEIQGEEGEDNDNIVDEGKEKSQEEENYKEIGAEVNGHSIIIRVLKKRKREKKSEDLNITPCCCPPEPPICPNAPILNVCSCDYPLPPELIPRCPVQCCSPPPPCCMSLPDPTSQHNSKNGFNPRKNVNVAECPREDCPLNKPRDPSSEQLGENDPGTVTMKGDQVVYQSSNKPGEPMSDKDKKVANSLYYKK